MRTGVIATKLGMSRVFDDSGQHIAVTLLHMDDVQVIKADKQPGGSSVQLGAGQVAKPSRLSASVRGIFAAAGVPAKRKLASFKVADDAVLDVGSRLSPEHFIPGQRVDVTGISIGKGFAGSMKRHNFGGMRASHGVSVSHRAHGSTGGCQDPGRVFKGKKMAGHMGYARVTVQNLKVVDIDTERSVIAVEGSVPGPRGGWLLLRDAVKVPRPEQAPWPAGLIKEGGVNQDATQDTNQDLPKDTPTEKGGVQEDRKDAKQNTKQDTKQDTKQEVSQDAPQDGKKEHKKQAEKTDAVQATLEDKKQDKTQDDASKGKQG